MRYLKLKNVPIKIINSGKYGGDGKNIPWGACGFNTTLVSMKSVQYFDVNGDHLSFIPISDEPLLKTKLNMMKEDSSVLGDSSSVTIVNKEYTDLVALKDASQPEV